MVSLLSMQSSNALISSTIAPGLVAVFIGGTSGIGETTLKQLAKHAIKPRLYFTGRSQEAADRIKAECTQLMKTENTTSSKQTQAYLRRSGTLVFGTKTEEDLHYALALAYYSRTRFIVNLLPLLQKAKGLRRVVSVFTGTKEGPINYEDLQGLKVVAIKGRGHASSMVTLSMEHMAKQAPTVSFVHDYPGFVKTGISRDTTGLFRVLLKTVEIVLGPFRYISNEECGERHLFLSTSAKFPPASAEGGRAPGAIPLGNGLTVAIGSDGKSASGMYTADEKCESGDPKVVTLLAELRSQGGTEKVLEHINEQFKRITGVEVKT